MVMVLILCGVWMGDALVKLASCAKLYSFIFRFTLRVALLALFLMPRVVVGPDPRYDSI